MRDVLQRLAAVEETGGAAAREELDAAAVAVTGAARCAPADCAALCLSSISKRLWPAVRVVGLSQVGLGYLLSCANTKPPPRPATGER